MIQRVLEIVMVIVLFAAPPWASGEQTGKYLRCRMFLLLERPDPVWILTETNDWQTLRNTLSQLVETNPPSWISERESAELINSGVPLFPDQVHFLHGFIQIKTGDRARYYLETEEFVRTVISSLQKGTALRERPDDAVSEGLQLLESHANALHLTDTPEQLVQTNVSPSIKKRCIGLCLTQNRKQVLSSARILAMTGETVPLRRTAIMALLKFGEAADTNLLNILLKDPNKDVRNDSNLAMEEIRLRVNPHRPEDEPLQSAVWSQSSLIQLPSLSDNIEAIMQTAPFSWWDLKGRKYSYEVQLLFVPTNGFVWCRLHLPRTHFFLLNDRLVGVSSLPGGNLLFRQSSGKISGQDKVIPEPTSQDYFKKYIEAYKSRADSADDDKRIHLDSCVLPVGVLGRKEVAYPPRAPDITAITMNNSNVLISMKTEMGKDVIIAFNEHLDAVAADVDGEKVFPVCVSKNNRSKVSVAKKAIEDFDGCRIEIEGINLEYAVPTLEVTSHTVANGRNIVRLKLNESSMQKIGKNKIWFGDKVIVVGTVKAKNMKVPEISVEDIRKIQ